MGRMFLGGLLVFFGGLACLLLLFELLGWRAPTTAGGKEAANLIVGFAIFILTGLLLVRSGWRLRGNRTPDLLDRVAGVIMFPFRALGWLLSKWPSGVTCGKCGKYVGYFADKGDRCPHCGVLWTEKRTVSYWG